MFLRDYQDKSVGSILTYFKIAPGKSPLVVAPTGAGKSVIISGFVQRCLRARPELSICIVTHVAELLAQNCNKLLTMMPELAPKIGFYCDSFKEKRIEQITLASIQSIYAKSNLFKKINILIIDEAHLIPKKDSGMYRTFIAGLKEINPQMGIIGLTATPFRLDSGLLTEGENKIFDDVCYDISVRELIDKGFHTKLISKHSKVQADVSGVKSRGGDYVLKDLEDVMNDDPLTIAAVNEMITWGADRKKWLVFCSGVDHATNVRDEIRSRGITCEMVCGETPKDERAKILKDFKAGNIKAVTNYGVLTTGYDEPEIDLVALLRATKSAGLYMQMVGRGCRIAPEKENCLVLDFGGNIERHGPIDCISVRKKGGKAKIDKLPTKKCPQCGNVLLIATKNCECGHVFEIKEKVAVDHNAEASNAPILNEPVDFDVVEVRYRKHKKEGKPSSFRVDYICTGGLNTISEYVCLDHDGFPRHKAFIWWHSHIESVWEGELPTVDEAILKQGLLRRPKKIRAVLEGKFWRILKTEFWEEDEEVVVPKTEADDIYEEYGINI